MINTLMSESNKRRRANIPSSVQMHYNSFTITLRKMIKKKDKLLEVIAKIKDTDSQAPLLLSFLKDQDLSTLLLSSKKYYVQLMPFMKVRQFNSEEANRSKQVKQNPKNKKKVKGNSNKKAFSSEQEASLEVEVQVEKVPITKWKSKMGPCLEDNYKKWHKIDKLPFFNAYLNKKLQLKSSIFYENLQSKQIIYINRSLVDPNLNYQKGAFDDQIDNDIYEEMYHEQSLQSASELDFSSRQAMLRRQKELLEKINSRKAKNQEAEQVSYEKELQKAILMKRFAIILCFGGSFSLGVYEGDKCILHKSDKKYVCRKKAGERQFNKDKQSGTSIKSMGSQIRREQQKKHIINVNQILNENEEALSKCEVIFLQAPGMNRLYIINENETMAKLQSKLRSVCLTAKKANFTEVSTIFDSINKFNIVKIKQQLRSI